MEIKYKTIGMGSKTPKYATENASCFDMYAAKDAVIKPSEMVAVNTGVVFEPEDGYGIMIYPRSGISAKTPLRLANSVGVIDNDYRGEVKVLLENIRPKDIKMRVIPAYMTVDGELVENNHEFGFLPEGTVVIRKGDRIAQAMPIKIEKANLVRVTKVGETKRGEGGFGSTGVK